MQRILIWDIWTRLFHWSLVVCVIFLLFSGKTGNGFYEWHRLVGEAVFALLLFRLCWSFFGSSNNRLSGLLTHPKKSIDHLGGLLRREVEPERGHNAAGGWAVLLMLMLLSVQALTGLFIADEEEFIEGAFYETIPADWSEELLHIHHFNSGLIIAIVVVHVLMIAIYHYWGRTNLVSRMLTGKLAWPDRASVPEVRFRHWSVGLIIVCCIFAAVGFLVGWL